MWTVPCWPACESADCKEINNDPEHAADAENFKKFAELDLCFSADRNVLVGDNESGKSTILLALDLVLSDSRQRVLPTVRKWVFRNLGGDFHARGLITRRLSNSNPARPYICRFSIFRRFTWPSTTPLLHLLLIASCIAVASASIPAATR